MLSLVAAVVVVGVYVSSADAADADEKSLVAPFGESKMFSPSTFSKSVTEVD